ncbi:MAG: RidA family protein [Pseudomonadales bacterium]
MSEQKYHKSFGGPTTLPGGASLPFSPAVAAGEFVFLSGQLALNAEGRAEGDVASQSQQIFRQMQQLLEQQALSLANVVKVNAWLTDKAGFSAFNKSFRAAFPNNPPARSTVISELLVAGALIEIEAVAWSGAS